MATELPESRDTSKLDLEAANAIALKYLELARNEILERIKVRYQTLTAYAGAVGAIGAWVYSKGPSVAGEGGLVVIAFLAVAASSILCDNEQVINALARYQLYALSKHFKPALPKIPLWELSEELGASFDKVVGGSLHNWIQASVVVLPAAIASYLLQSLHAAWTWDVLAWSCTFFAFILSLMTPLERRGLRRERKRLS